MKRLTLAQQLSIVFAALLLACSGVSIWLQINFNTRHEQEVVQRLSGDLAKHIASTAQLMDANGWKPYAVRELFDELMAVNPSVELYLLSNIGQIVGSAASAGELKLDRVDLSPVRKLLSGAPLPVLGQDPRSIDASKVFSAAPVRVNGKDAGYVYVILQGQARDALAGGVSTGSVLRITLSIMWLMALLLLVMGLIAFRLITRPLRALTQTMSCFDGQVPMSGTSDGHTAPLEKGDEITTLRKTFEQMSRRISEQWRELTRQDQQRRDLVANISHDLRTPLTALHGYLETLRVKDDILTPDERRHYLDVALGQSRKVGRLAQELFELARLESGLVRPELETFSLVDVVQDVLQKFELAAEARQQQLRVEMPHGLPAVRADLGMIERVLTNLLDNAIRHTPPKTLVVVSLQDLPAKVRVEIRDTGRGIPLELREGLFTRASALNHTPNESGGLGLIIVQRMLQLHGTQVQLIDSDSPGSVFRFSLDAA